MFQGWEHTCVAMLVGDWYFHGSSFGILVLLGHRAGERCFSFFIQKTT